MPLSNDPEKRERQLANLRAAPPAPIGNTRTRTHGGLATAKTMDVSAEVREVFDALAAAAPVRDFDGGLPAADEAAVEIAALALKRWRSVNAWCELHGRFEEKTGAEKPAARYELDAERALHKALDVLGMNPTSRMKLGLDVARAQSLDLARAWAEGDHAA